MSHKELFEKRFIELLLTNGTMDSEVNDLFEHVLVNDFDNDASLMDEYIQQLHNSVKEPEKSVEQRQDELEKEIRNLSEKLEDEKLRR